MSSVIDAVIRRVLPVAADRAGAGAGVRFTERQLYHEVCRMVLPRGALPDRLLVTVPAPLSHRRFRAALGRSGQLPGLLAPAIPAAAGSPRLGRFATEPDLFDYGLPQVLVCQDRAVAAMLVANDLHLEAACPIFGESDLPDDPRFVAALSRGGTNVYVLHDASLVGFRVNARIQRWVGGVPGVRIVPLGLRPRHAAALHLTVGPAVSPSGSEGGTGTAGGHAGEQETRSGGGPGRAGLDGMARWERAWLRTGWNAEVAAVPPARLLRALHRMLRGTPRHRGAQPGLRGVRDVGFLTWPPD